MSFSRMSAAWVSCTDREVSSTSELVMPWWTKRRVRTDRLGQPGQEGDDVVAGFTLDRVDPLDVGRGHGGELRAALFADGAGGAAGMAPMRAMPSAARASTSNQMR